MWGAIALLISQFEKFIGQFNCNYVYISAQKILDYADIDKEKYT